MVYLKSTMHCYPIVIRLQFIVGGQLYDDLFSANVYCLLQNNYEKTFS